MSWRDRAGRHIARVFRDHGRPSDPAERRRLLAAHYPFEERCGWAYASWLRALRDHCGWSPQGLAASRRASERRDERSGQGRLF